MHGIIHNIQKTRSNNKHESFRIILGQLLLFISVALRLDGSEATFTISSGNLNSYTLRRAVDGDPNTCIWPRPAVSIASTVNLTFTLFNCRAVFTVEIMTGNSNIGYIPGVAIQEIDRCHGDRHFPQARCYAQTLQGVNPIEYQCPGKQSRIVDIVVPANLPICEIEINHVPIPGIQRILSWVVELQLKFKLDSKYRVHHT